MFRSINEEFERAKNARTSRRFIQESVLEVEEVIPGSDDDINDAVDADSVPDEAYRKVDAALDQLISSPDYDDTEVEEMVDADDDDIDDSELEAIIDEACNSVGAWMDDENIGHPDKDRRSSSKNQPKFMSECNK